MLTQPSGPCFIVEFGANIHKRARVPDARKQFQDLLGAEVGTNFTDMMFGGAAKVQVK